MTKYIASLDIFKIAKLKMDQDAFHVEDLVVLPDHTIIVCQDGPIVDHLMLPKDYLRKVDSVQSIRRINIKPGKEIWRSELSHDVIKGNYSYAPNDDRMLRISGTRLLFGYGVRKKLWLVDINNGRVLSSPWQNNRTVRLIAVHDDHVIIWDKRGFLASYNVNNLKKLWTIAYYKRPELVCSLDKEWLLMTHSNGQCVFSVNIYSGAIRPINFPSVSQLKCACPVGDNIYLVGGDMTWVVNRNSNKCEKLSSAPKNTGFPAAIDAGHGRAIKERWTMHGDQILQKRSVLVDFVHSTSFEFNKLYIIRDCIVIGNDRLLCRYNTYYSNRLTGESYFMVFNIATKEIKHLKGIDTATDHMDVLSETQVLLRGFEWVVIG